MMRIGSNSATNLIGQSWEKNLKSINYILCSKSNYEWAMRARCNVEWVSNNNAKRDIGYE